MYHFPIDAPFKLICGDIYKAGDILAYQGESALFIIQDMMTGFAVIEELTELNSVAFTKVAMKVLLQHSICHTFIVDKDSKFRSLFEKVIGHTLKINLYPASGGNHDAIMVERFNAFLNKSLRIFCSERDTTRAFVEGAQLTAYAWNSAPMAETDISRSLVAVGREFQFPIDFIRDDINLDISLDSKISYANSLQKRLQCCQEVYKVLIDEHRCMHREYVNARRPDPFKFEKGDYVWVRRQIQSNKARGIVGKLRFQQTGPWEITACLPG